MTSALDVAVQRTLDAWDGGASTSESDPLFAKPNLRSAAKYLSRPPFKFLVDIILQTLQGTGVANGLYSKEEVANVKSKDKTVCTKTVKMSFLLKAIAFTQCLGKTDAMGIDVTAVDPRQIVSGKEPENTNKFLSGFLKIAREFKKNPGANAAQNANAVETATSFIESGKGVKDLSSITQISFQFGTMEEKSAERQKEEKSEESKTARSGLDESKAQESMSSSSDRRQREQAHNNHEGKSSMETDGPSSTGGGFASSQASYSLSSCGIDGDLESTKTMLAQVLSENEKKLIKDRLLSRPPFRYLFDLFHMISKRSGMGKGLFEGMEKFQRKVKVTEREDKLEFLERINLYLRFHLDVSEDDLPNPKKTISGKDSDRVRQLIQWLVFCALEEIQGRRNSNDAVQFVQNSAIVGKEKIPYFSGGRKKDFNNEFERAKMHMLHGDKTKAGTSAAGTTSAGVSSPEKQRLLERMGVGSGGDTYSSGHTGQGGGAAFGSDIDSKEAGGGNRDGGSSQHPQQDFATGSSAATTTTTVGLNDELPDANNNAESEFNKKKTARPSTARRKPPKVKENVVIESKSGPQHFDNDKPSYIVMDNDNDTDDDEDEDSNEENEDQEKERLMQGRKTYTGPSSLEPSGGNAVRGKLTKGLGRGGADGGEIGGSETKDDSSGRPSHRDGMETKSGEIRMKRLSRRGRRNKQGGDDASAHGGSHRQDHHHGKKGSGSGGSSSASSLSSLASIDIGKLRDTVQKLCQSSNPIGKCMDYVPNDIALMRKEFRTWNAKQKEYTEKFQRMKVEREVRLRPFLREFEDVKEKVRIMEDSIFAAKQAVVRNNQRLGNLIDRVVSH